MYKRIVITGMGVLTPHSSNTSEFLNWITSPDRDENFQSIIIENKYSFQKRLSKYFNSKFGYVQAGYFDYGKIKTSVKNLNNEAKVLYEVLKETVASSVLLRTKDLEGEKIGVINTSIYGPMISGRKSRRELLMNFFPSFLLRYFNIHGPFFTLRDGENSSVLAIEIAKGIIESGDCSIVLIGGISCLKGELVMAELLEELRCFTIKCRRKNVRCEETFNKKFSEGAVFIALEDLESAIQRKANILAEISGVFSFNKRVERVARDNEFLKAIKNNIVELMSTVIKSSELSIEDISLIDANLPRNYYLDKAELMAVRELMDGDGERRIISTKTIIGEISPLNAFFSLILAINALDTDIIQGGLFVEEENPNLFYRRKEKIDAVLINSFSRLGNYSSLLLKRYNP